MSTDRVDLWSKVRRRRHRFFHVKIALLGRADRCEREAGVSSDHGSIRGRLTFMEHDAQKVMRERHNRGKRILMEAIQ